MWSQWGVATQLWASDNHRVGWDSGRYSRAVLCNGAAVGTKERLNRSFDSWHLRKTTRFLWALPRPSLCRGWHGYTSMFLVFGAHGEKEKHSCMMLSVYFQINVCHRLLNPQAFKLKVTPLKKHIFWNQMGPSWVIRHLKHQFNRCIIELLHEQIAKQ